MIRKIAVTLILFSFGSLSQAAEGSASRSTSCVESVRRCFDFSEDDRSTCLHEAYEASYCKGNELRSVIELRSGASSEEKGAKPHASLVDGRCIEQCDFQLVRSLFGESVEKDLSALRSCYKQCRVEEPRPMFRP